MSDYDFKTLNDKEFEILAADLLSARDAVRYERFKPGRDNGVDGRYFSADGGEVVLQSKHWVSSPLEKLVQHLSKVEFAKVQKLRPKKYVLVVSHALSRTDKDSIVKILAPYITSPSDVLGREDLNDLLAKNPKIEKRHYKLWISSTTVLRHLLNKAIYDRSAFSAAEILEGAHLYVPTKNHDLAIQKLEKLGSVIITGPAGIGKTTLADHLCLHYLNQQFSLIRIADEVREAESVFDPEEKQVFYFDDFLGRNYLEALSGHEGSHIVQFMRRVAKDRKKRFVLTSRTTILNQGKLLLDVFQNNNLDRNEFEVTLESFKEMDKARILYNHLWHSTLADGFIDSIYENKRYKEIIRHRNYNPRLIRFITDVDRLTDCPPSGYWQHIKSLLDNPKSVWQNPFESQIDDFGRALVLLVAINGRPITQAELAECFARYTAQPNASSYQGKRDFLVNLKHLTGSFLTRTTQDGVDAGIDLFNPSIGDFVLNRYAADIPGLRVAVACLRSTHSLRTIRDITSNKIIRPEDSEVIHRHVLQKAIEQDFVGYSSAYIAEVCLQLAWSSNNLDETHKVISSAVNFVIESQCPLNFRYTAELVNRSLEAELITERQAANFIDDACTCEPTSDELEQLGQIHLQLGDSLKLGVGKSLKKAVLSYLLDSMYDEFPNDEVFESVNPEDLLGADSNLRQLIVSKSESYGVDFSDNMIDQIVDAFDIEHQADSYFQMDGPDDDNREPVASFHLDEIDDLFDRTV